jgi:hypothetical protein
LDKVKIYPKPRSETCSEVQTTKNLPEMRLETDITTLFKTATKKKHMQRAHIASFYNYATQN